MQSSAMVALRTMIMLACLVAVPLAAVLGTALPRVVKAAFGRREPRPPALARENEPAARSPHHALTADDPPPRAVQAASLAPAERQPEPLVPPSLPRARITGVRTVDDSPSPDTIADEPMIETAPLWNPSPRTASTPRGRPMTTHFAPSPAPRHPLQPPSPPDTAGQQASHGARRRADRQEALQKTVYSPPDTAAAGANTAGDDALGPDDRLAPVERVANTGVLADGERRMRELGATYYRLEMWGNDGTFYRCSCSVPLNPRGRAVRHFESIEGAPSQAIDAVIKQVEAWRAKRAAG